MLHTKNEKENASSSNKHKEDNVRINTSPLGNKTLNGNYS